jgi:predicted patatin/cPLA2 family phospholipase
MVTAQIRLHRCWQARALRWTCVFGILALVGCALPRRDAPPTLFSSASPVDFPADVRFLSTDRASVEAKSTAALRRLRSSSKDGRVRALVLSGGGAGGAFGAGALVGLSRRQERPQYDVVTGVSAGALIAPFAFLGPEWDAQLTEAFTSGRGEQMSVRGLLELSFGTSRRSAALTALVDHYVTPDLIKAVAKEAGSGRLLWVATTDLDKQETVIWDLGAIAMRGGEPARKLFRDVLVASASIPGVFEPVLIHVQQGGRLYDEMHVDGGASTSLFIAPVAAYFALLDQRALDGARVYVLINGQIIEEPETTPFKLGSIVARTFSVALKHMSRAQVVAVDQFADKYRMSVRSTYLPFDYPKFSSSDFRASTMRPLFEYGARCAESGHLWTTMDETMATVAAEAPASRRTRAVDEEVACPLRDVHLTAGSTR